MRGVAGVAAWVVLVAALVAVGEAIVSSVAVRSFDARILRDVVDSRRPALVEVMRAVTWLGSWVAVVVLAVVVIGLRLTRRVTTAFVVLAALAWGGTQGGVTIVKHVVHRHRPPPSVRLVTTHGWSFPSGHAATATTVAVVAVALVFALTSRRALRAAAVAGGCLLASAVAASRVLLGAHWPTDVAGGIAFALLWALVVLAATTPALRRVALAPPGRRVAVPRGASVALGHDPPGPARLLVPAASLPGG